MAKIFRNYTTLAEYEADTNKPVNTVCFIKDAKVIYVNDIQYSYKQLDYLPPAITEAEALEYMGKIIKNAQEVGLIYVKPVHTTVPTIYWKGDYNTISISGTNYTAQADKVNIDGVEYYQVKLDKDLDDNFYRFNENKFTNLMFKNVDMTKITIMNSMFRNCESLTSLNLSGWDTSKVTDMYQMFYGCKSMVSLNLTGFNINNVTNIESIFRNCESLTSIDLSGWNTSKITIMYSLFYGCQALTSLDLANWNTSKVTNMESMFNNCKSLTFLDLSGWDTSNVTSMYHIFYECSALKTIRMVGCSQTTIDKIKAQLTTDGITGCTIVTE